MLLLFLLPVWLEMQFYGKSRLLPTKGKYKRTYPLIFWFTMLLALQYSIWVLCSHIAHLMYFFAKVLIARTFLGDSRSFWMVKLRTLKFNGFKMKTTQLYKTISYYTTTKYFQVQKPVSFFLFHFATIFLSLQIYWEVKEKTVKSFGLSVFCCIGVGNEKLRSSTVNWALLPK